MNKDWQDKLTSFGASVDSEGTISFADETGAIRVRVAGAAQDNFPLLVESVTIGDDRYNRS